MSASSKKTYRLDDHVGYLMRQATQRHTTLFQKRMPDGLTPTQFAALARLYEKGPCPQNQLGRRTSMDVATIKGVVDRLRQKGLVETASSEQDKRMIVVALTSQGRRMIRRATDEGHKISADTLAPLDDGERAQFLALLKKLT